MGKFYGRVVSLDLDTWRVGLVITRADDGLTEVEMRKMATLMIEKTEVELAIPVDDASEDRTTHATPVSDEAKEKRDE